MYCVSTDRRDKCECSYLVYKLVPDIFCINQTNFIRFEISKLKQILDQQGSYLKMAQLLLYLIEF